MDQMDRKIVCDDEKLFKEPLKTFITSRLREIGKARVQVSREIDKTLSYMSQAESGLVNFSQELAELYSTALQLNGERKNDFKQLVAFSNSRKNAKNQNPAAKRLAALIEVFGDTLDDNSIAKIEVSISNAIRTKAPFSPYRKSRPPTSGDGLTPQRFIEIVQRTEAIRSAFSVSNRYCNISDLIEEMENRSPTVKITFHEKMPRRFGDAYACVEHWPNGSEFHFDQEIYVRAFDGCWVSRHMLAHEVGHHILEHTGLRFLQPSIITKGTTRIKSTNLRCGPNEESEADLAGTLLLVPWRIMLTRPSAVELARQYRSEPKQTARTIGLVNVPSVRSQLEQMM